MKSVPLLVLAAIALAACGDPIAEQAASDARDRPTRADQMLAFDFAPGSARLDPSQENQVQALVAEPHGRRDEFVVVTDGMGGPIQQSRAAHVANRLSQAGARWVSRVGRAVDGARPRPGRGGALGVPPRHARLPDPRAVIDLESRTNRTCRASAAPPPTTWARCWPGRVMPPSVVRRVRPMARSVPTPSSVTAKVACAQPSAAVSAVAVAAGQGPGAAAAAAPGAGGGAGAPPTPGY